MDCEVVWYYAGWQKIEGVIFFKILEAIFKVERGSSFLRNNNAYLQNI
jgi:hypothetical protein